MPDAKPSITFGDIAGTVIRWSWTFIVAAFITVIAQWFNAKVVTRVVRKVPFIGGAMYAGLISKLFMFASILAALNIGNNDPFNIAQKVKNALGVEETAEGNWFMFW